MKRYRIGQFAEISVTVQTIRNWDKRDKLKPDCLPSGHQYYSQKQLDYFLGLHSPESLEKVTIGYCRLQGKQANQSKKIIKELKEG